MFYLLGFKDKKKQAEYNKILRNNNIESSVIFTALTGKGFNVEV